MTPYRHQVAAAIRVVRILSTTRFAWFDRASPALPRRTMRALDAEAARAHLVTTLRQSLYLGFYAAGSPVPEAAPPVRPARCPDFVAALSRANSGRGTWTAGWVVREIEDEAVVVERDELRLRAPAGSWRMPDGTDVHVGAPAELLTPKEQLGISPGFYLAQGDVELAVSGGAKLVRVYFDTTADGAALLMASVTRGLNERKLAFRFKVVGHPDCFTRRDAAVLYLEQDDFEVAAPALTAALCAARSEVGSAVPAFTKRLASGVALAESPPESVSFGWHRCGLVAEALIDAHERGLRGLEPRVERVRERFAEVGLSLETPYLNAGSCDRYRFADA